MFNSSTALFYLNAVTVKLKRMQTLHVPLTLMYRLTVRTGSHIINTLYTQAAKLQMLNYMYSLNKFVHPNDHLSLEILRAQSLHTIKT